ncbi:hypothetical protein ACGFK1_29065 [Mycobacterium sp. NPDC048908]
MRPSRSVARRQLPQFIIVSIITLGVFTVLYLGGYAVGAARVAIHR